MDLHSRRRGSLTNCQQCSSRGLNFMRRTFGLGHRGFVLPKARSDRGLCFLQLLTGNVTTANQQLATFTIPARLVVNGFAALDHSVDFSLSIFSGTDTSSCFSTLPRIERRQRQWINLRYYLPARHHIASTKIDASQLSRHRSRYYITIANTSLPFTIDGNLHWTTRCFGGINSGRRWLQPHR